MVRNTRGYLVPFLFLAVLCCGSSFIYQGIGFTDTLLSVQNGLLLESANPMKSYIHRRFILPASVSYGKISVHDERQQQDLRKIMADLRELFSVTDITLYDPETKISFISTIQGEPRKIAGHPDVIRESVKSDKALSFVAKKTPYWRLLLPMPLGEKAFLLRAVSAVAAEPLLRKTQAPGEEPPAKFWLMEYEKDVTPMMREWGEGQRARFAYSLAFAVLAAWFMRFIPLCRRNDTDGA